MGMDLYYHAFEKVGDYPVSNDVVTTFPAGAPTELNSTDGGLQIGATEANILGLAKVSRSQMVVAGPSVQGSGGTNQGSATVVTGITIVELYDNSDEIADDGSPMADAISAYAINDRLYFSAGKWQKAAAGAPFGRVLEAAANSNLGGVVAYFNFTIH